MGHDQLRYSVECTGKANTPAMLCIPARGLKYWRMAPRSYVVYRGLSMPATLSGAVMGMFNMDQVVRGK